MNVRFFGGYKSEYVSIPKHNPIGLYFCADSRELFLGDKLLSDGLRVVPTFADLPSISEHKAAEGVIYFVESTKNGYVLPRGGYDWLQVIYAPTSGEGAEVDLSNYYTKAEVDAAILKAITNIELEVDLSNYATKAELAAIEAKIPSIEGLASTDYVDNKVASITIPSIAGLATESFVRDEIAKIDIPEVPTKVSELENDAGYLTEHQDISHLATKEELQEAISSIEQPIIDLSGYATKDYVKATAAKYEVLPVEGMLISYRDGEIRLNTQRVVPVKQNVGATGNSNMFYVTFHAYAPEGATRVIEGLINGTTGNVERDTNFSSLSIDKYGRKYTTIWAAVASTSDGTTWTKWGDLSTTDKYLGHRYVLDWYNDEKLIETARISVILTNDACHDDMVSEAVTKRIIEKTTALSDEITNITQQVENIENTYVQNTVLENYVTNDYITQNYVTNNYIVENYTTTAQLEEKVTEVVTQEVSAVVVEQVETKVSEVIQEKVDTGEIEVKAVAITYGEF